MEEQNNKTIICSVFFLDIVEYSKKSVSWQISLKERFNAFLSIAIRDVPVNDRIILDTGDGAAISFLGDLSDALHAALSMRSSLLNEGVRMEPPLLVRMGVNLGPVRLVKDINGQPNIVGDGINVAQRVMGFADPGQILVSRSYYDAVSRLSQEYAGMFHYQGSRTDKHVREHEVYAIGYPGDFTSTQQSLARLNRHENASGLDLVMFKLENIWDRLLAKTESWERRLLDFYRRITDKQRAALMAGLAVVAISLLALLINLLTGHATKPPLTSEVKETETVAARQATNEKQDSQPASRSVPIPEPVAEPAPPVRVEKKVQGVKESARVRTLIETTGAPAVVSLSVQPWGEIYLDGRLQGVSPPLMELQVLAGKHEIKIKNTKFPPFTEVIRVKSGEKIKIKYKFVE